MVSEYQLTVHMTIIVGNAAEVVIDLNLNFDIFIQRENGTYFIL